MLSMFFSCGVKKIFEVDIVTNSSFNGIYSDATRHLGTPLPNVSLRFYYGTVNRVRKIGLGADTVTESNGNVKLPYMKKTLKLGNDGRVIASKHGFISDTLKFDYPDLKNSRIIINLEEIK